jgi:hypothetical protein
VRLAFILVEVLYVVNGLDRIVHLLLKNQLFERSWTNKHVSVQDVMRK